MESHSIVLLCVVGLFAFNEIASLRKVIREQDKRISQLEELVNKNDL
jgi:hypothetical protein